MITIVSIICLIYMNICIPQRRNNRHGIISIPITRCNAVFRIGIYTIGFTPEEMLNSICGQKEIIFFRYLSMHINRGLYFFSSKGTAQIHFPVYRLIGYITFQVILIAYAIKIKGCMISFGMEIKIT